MHTIPRVLRPPHLHHLLLHACLTSNWQQPAVQLQHLHSSSKPFNMSTLRKTPRGSPMHHPRQHTSLRLVYRPLPRLSGPGQDHPLSRQNATTPLPTPSAVWFLVCPSSQQQRLHARFAPKRRRVKRSFTLKNTEYKLRPLFELRYIFH